MGAFVAPNPPSGAVIDYYVPGDAADETTVTSVTGSREQTPAMPNGRHGASIVITDRLRKYRAQNERPRCAPDSIAQSGR